MHTGINCIRAQQSRRGTAAVMGSLRKDTIRKRGAIPKTRILRHIEMPKNTLKYKKEPFCTFLSISILSTFLSCPASDPPPTSPLDPAARVSKFHGTTDEER